MGNQKFGRIGRASTIMMAISISAFAPALARAQEPVHTLQGLSSDIYRGDTIRVKRADGKTVQGRLESISGSSLKVNSDGVSGEFREPQILEVKLQYRDPIKNGVVIGALVGLVSGAVLGAVVADAFCDGCGNNAGGGAMVLGLFGTGIGAGVGAASDSMKKGYKTVFTAQRVAEKGFGVSPLLSRQKKGVAVAFRF